MRKKELIKKVELLEEKVTKHEITIKNMLEIILNKQRQEEVQKAVDGINKFFEKIFKQPAKQQAEPIQAKRERGRPRKYTSLEVKPKRPVGRPRKNKE